VRSTDACMIQYTSGTRDSPKGLAAPSRPRQQRRAHGGRAGIPDGAVQVTTMPLFHTGGASAACRRRIEARDPGAGRSFDPGLVIELMDTYRCNAMLGVPTMLVAMMEHPSFCLGRSFLAQGDLFGGSTVPAQSSPISNDGWARLSHRVRTDRVLAGRVDDLGHRQLADKANTIGTPMPNVE